jgi:Fe-S-cluster containining protein
MSKKNKKNKFAQRYKKIKRSKELIQQGNESQFQKLLRQFKNLRKEILREGKCNRCGICCSKFRIKLTQKDLDNEPKLLEYFVPMSEVGNKKFGTKYIGRLKIVSKDSMRCVFYDEETGCKIHSTKPAECVAYMPSLSHCKEAELKGLCDLKKYYNMHQKACSEGIESCGEEEKIERLIRLISAFIAPFILTFHKNEESVVSMEPDHKKPIPLFIKKCLELDDSYQFVEDLPLVKNIKTNNS